MIQLTANDKDKLIESIVSVYVRSDQLALLLFSKLDKNLEVEAGSGSLDVVAFRLIQRAIARGYIEDLIVAIAKDATGRKDVQKLCTKILQQRMVLNHEENLVDGLALPLDIADWDLDIQAEELESFIPKRFSFQADVGKLRDGLDLASAVCKITFSDRPPEVSGTGVLIASDLVLTNYHVLSTKEGVDLNKCIQTAQFDFGYVSTRFGRTETFKAVASSPIEAYSPIEELDYALIRLNIPHPDSFKIEPVPLNESANLTPRSPLNLLQHPEGEALKVSLSNNGVVKTRDNLGLVLYVNPTKGGSSGSPCFDDDWQLVALHHKNLQTSFGSVREGILWSAIQDHINKKFPSVIL